MAQSKMSEAKRELLEELIANVHDLSNEQIEILTEYAKDLRLHSVSQEPERGTPEAILQALEAIGPLQFEEGELDRLLAEIEDLRQLDLDRDG